ncbi:MAG TPA: hypothetical protein VHG69_13090, partial [Thermoleophilaceae bacterium]|nr:hypothetical protein [Thermoleophilaceae bacterium]
WLLSLDSEPSPEDRGAAAIDRAQAERACGIRAAVRRGDLPPQALEIVEVDGTINPDFVGGPGDDDTLRWDLDGDGHRERVTERDVYDASLGARCP